MPLYVKELALLCCNFCVSPPVNANFRVDAGDIPALVFFELHSVISKPGSVPLYRGAFESEETVCGKSINGAAHVAERKKAYICGKIIYEADVTRITYQSPTQRHRRVCIGSF